MDVHGEYLNQFGEQVSLDHQLESPYGLSVESKGDIIAPDSGNKLIKIFFLVASFRVKLELKALERVHFTVSDLKTFSSRQTVRNIVFKFLIGRVIFCTNLEWRGRETGSSITLVTCQLTRQVT